MVPSFSWALDGITLTLRQKDTAIGTVNEPRNQQTPAMSRPEAGDEEEQRKLFRPVFCPSSDRRLKAAQARPCYPEPNSNFARQSYL